MSRIGKKELNIPAGTDVTVDNRYITIKGKGGEIKRALNSNITVTIEGNQVKVLPANKSKLANALWGTYSSHINNMILGVNTPFVKELIVEGIGFKVAIKGSILNLKVGYSHDVDFNIPDGIAVKAEKNNIHISGIDKEKIGQFAAVVRASKKPEPYKGKGIRYSDEIIRRKRGKRAAA
jgi:large subunit ribosomal protein L6